MIAANFTTVTTPAVQAPTGYAAVLATPNPGLPVETVAELRITIAAALLDVAASHPGCDFDTAVTFLRDEIAISLRSLRAVATGLPAAFRAATAHVADLRG